MPTIEFTSDEKNVLLEIMERAEHSLRIEIVNTDRREFRRALKERELIMVSLLDRLRNAPN